MPRSDDDVPEVDFVLDDIVPAGDEEVLSTGEALDRSRMRRLRLDLAVAGVVLGAAVLVARNLSGGSDGAQARPSISPSPAASARDYGTGAPDSGSGLLNGAATVTVSARGGRIVIAPHFPGGASDDPASCPTGVDCHAVQTVAAPVLAAVRSIFPGMTLESATTVRLDVGNSGGALWFLQVNARAGAKQILLRLQAQRRSDADRQGVVRADAGRSITYYEHALLRYHVVVQVDAPSVERQPLAPLQRLARDVRLVALA
jgi:hypothetical protein